MKHTFKIMRATEARSNFQDIIDTVYYQGNDIVISKRGKPWVAIRPLSNEEKEKFVKQIKETI